MIPHLDVVRAYLRAIEDGDARAVLDLYAPDAIQIEHPNHLKPNGDRRGPSQLAVDFEKGRGLLRRQKYEISAVFERGDEAVVQVFWTGVLAVELGGLQPGDAIRAHSAIFFRFSNGRIAHQENYDCFEPFGLG